MLFKRVLFLSVGSVAIMSAIIRLKQYQVTLRSPGNPCPSVRDISQAAHPGYWRIPSMEKNRSTSLEAGPRS